MDDPCTWDEGRIRVVVADDTRIHSQLLADAMKRDRRIQVVASVSTSRELFDIVAKQSLDIVVLSCSLDEEPSHGFDVLRELHALRPGLRTVMLLDSSKREIVVEAFRAGATGIFSKHGSWRTLCKCVRCIHEGQIWANSEELTFALEALSTVRPVRAVDAKGISLLSKRELEVVKAVSEGLTNREIGDRLKLSRHTIKNYLLRIFDKVGVSNRMELIYLTLRPPATIHPAAAYESDIEAAPAAHYEAAQRGVPSAQFKLAQIYKDGIGIDQDLESAYMWCLLSEKSNLSARDQITALRKKIAESMTEDQILAAKHKAAEWPNRSNPKKPSSRIPGFDDVRLSEESAKLFSAD